MGWKERPVWMQSVAALIFLVLWFLAVFVEISFLINIFFAIIGAALLLIICNRSRRWGLIIGMVVYLIWTFAAYRSGMNCYALAREGSLCGLWIAVPVFGLALIPIGALVGALIGWVINKIRGKEQ